MLTTGPVLVTGAAGFIGFHVARRLCALGHRVVGIDNLNAYYDPALKQARLDLLATEPGFRFEQLDLGHQSGMASLFDRTQPETVIHMAAQAGVRYSLENPHAYANSNLTGFLNILEGCRRGGVRHLTYASSSSVYGLNRSLPFSERHAADHPISLYGATKRANEMMAHSYSHMFRLPATGLRFFTVYGPWGRPDMALYKFTRAIMAGEPIEVFNEGRMERDFTYIDDIVEGVVRIAARPARPDATFDPANPRADTSSAPHRLYNIGNHSPVPLERLISLLEESIGKKAERRLLPMQPGDVQSTHANVDTLMSDADFRPDTPIEIGVPRFVAWYRSYHGL